MDIDTLPHPDSPVIEVEADECSPSTAVVNAVMDASDSPVREMPPLYEEIDPESLDEIFAPSDAGLAVFHYAGYLVCVDANERVAVFDHD